jgi:hypothetical protein
MKVSERYTRGAMAFHWINIHAVIGLLLWAS